jgi:hypothetical protein
MIYHPIHMSGPQAGKSDSRADARGERGHNIRSPSLLSISILGAIAQSNKHAQYPSFAFSQPMNLQSNTSIEIMSVPKQQVAVYLPALR